MKNAIERWAKGMRSKPDKTLRLEVNTTFQRQILSLPFGHHQTEIFSSESELVIIKTKKGEQKFRQWDSS